MDEEVKFFTEGLGMKIVRQREVNGARNVFVAYGQETLANKDGGENESSTAVSGACVGVFRVALVIFSFERLSSRR